MYHSHNGGAGRLRWSAFVLVLKEDILLRSNNEVLRGSSTRAGVSRSTLKVRRSGGAERGRGGKSGL